MHIIDKDDDGDEDEQCFWGEQKEDRAFVAETRREFMTLFFPTDSPRKRFKSEENFKRKIFQYSTPLKLNVNSSNFPK